MIYKVFRFLFRHIEPRLVCTTWEKDIRGGRNKVYVMIRRGYDKNTTLKNVELFWEKKWKP